MITDCDEFEAEMRRIDESVDRCAALPHQVFREAVHRFLILEFDIIWTIRGFEAVKRLTKAVGDRRFAMAVLDPDPVKYFHRHFGKYPLLRFSADDDAKSYLARVNEDPGGSPADAVVHNSNVLLLYPQSFRWIAYMARDLEIGVIGATDEEAAQAVAAAMAPVKIYDVGAAVRTLLPAIYRGRVPDEIASALRANYGERRPTGE